VLVIIGVSENVFSIYKVDWFLMVHNKTIGKRYLTNLVTAVAALFSSFVVTHLAFASNLDYKLEAKKIAPDTYVFEGANDDFSKSNGCNIINTGFIVTSEGVVVINTGVSKLYGEQQRAAITKVTNKKIKLVLNLNLHPDYFLGNQAYSDIPIAALAVSIDGMRLEGASYTDNLYRICGDWMSATESKPATQVIQPGPIKISDSNHQLELFQLSGHTAADLVLWDKSTGVVFAGGIVFADRTPTTPHANIPGWLKSLETVSKWNTSKEIKVLVPSHGPFIKGLEGINQTKDYLNWLDQSFETAALQGLDISEVLNQAIPYKFRGFAALKPEYLRNVTHLYPQYEKQIFPKELKD
jgi:quinoprotein relay system zinc metallohydrolase 1